MLLDLGCDSFHVRHYKGEHNICHWWKLSQFHILERRTWRRQWFFCWQKLVHWVLVEYHWDRLVVWVFPKDRSNHCWENKLWIILDQMHLSESISAFGLCDIKFLYQGDFLHSQEIDWLEIWYTYISWSKGIRWWYQRLCAWCCQLFEDNNWKNISTVIELIRN